MKILAISHLFPHQREPRYGIFVARQLSGMYRLGADVTVIVPRVWCPKLLRHFERWKDQDHATGLCEFDGLQTLSVPYVRPPGNWYNRWSGLAVFWAARKKALELHSGKKFDIIYATDFFPDGDAAVRLSRYLSLPTACLAIGVDVNVTAHSSKTIYRRFVKVVRSLDGTLACGQSVAEGIKAVTGETPLSIYGVLDLEEFSPEPHKTGLRTELGLPAGGVIALYAGYLARRKGVYDLVEVFDRIRSTHRDAMLVMCGSGPEQTRLSEMIRGKGIERVVRLVGEVEPDEMSRWMKASDLFVLASHTEGMPNVVMEAMACGLPVVATAVGGLPAAVGDCEGAILVPPENIDALEEAIVKVMRDKELRVRMGAAGRRRAEEKFGVEKNARAILDYLEKIVLEKRNTRGNGVSL